METIGPDSEATLAVYHYLYFIFISVVTVHINRVTSDSAGDPAVRLSDGTCIPHSHCGWWQFHRDQCIHAGRQGSDTDCHAATSLHSVTGTAAADLVLKCAL